MRYLVPRAFAIAIFLPVFCGGQLPSTLQPPASQHVILTVQGRGSQIYGCRSTGGVFEWKFQAPVARLFDTGGNEVGTHGDGPTWNYDDSSSVSGVLAASSPSPEQGNIPWLLLKAANPQRTGVLTVVEFILRSDTHGGTAPTTGCDAGHDGNLTRVPYTATYTFYSSRLAN